MIDYAFMGQDPDAANYPRLREAFENTVQGGGIGCFIPIRYIGIGYSGAGLNVRNLGGGVT